ncbi:putative inactive histone-lysine N-methyltransferase SUVR2 [Bidens hawaiensis]|uniref:putative inactive histone-lysine N-methyltransferase SUVR2 n=1 Tax=Bidens hawaiensis TaxID=980011 RepID=UPI00404A38B1
MAPNPRVAKAFRAMRDIGIPEEKTKPVLKNLLKIYEKNWELIEEENYRALADAIFDSEEAQASEQQKKNDVEAEEQKKKLEQAERLKAIEEETQIPEEPERPLKRLRLRHQKGPSGTTSNPNSHLTPLKKPKIEIDDLPFAIPRSQSRAQNATNEPVSVSPQPKNKGKEPVLTEPDGANVIGSDLGLRPRRVRDKGKELMSPQTGTRELKSGSDRPLHGVRYKEPKPKQTSLPLIKPKDEPVADDAPPLPLPISIVGPEPTTNGDSSTENPSTDSNKDSTTNILPSSTETNGHELGLVPDEPTSKIDIASSSNGEIKISLSCNPTQNPNLSVTNADTLLKRIEDRVLKSYTTLDLNFSVKKLMTFMCDSLLDTKPEPVSTPPTDPLTETATHTVNNCQPLMVNGSVGNEPKDTPENGFQDTEPLPTVNGSVCNEVDDTTENELQDTEPQNQLTSTRSLHDINDIAKGHESVIISLVNEVNTECPPAFHYISGNAVFQNAYVNFSLARIGDDNSCSACFGDCLTSETACACALQSGGEFAYTKDGLVKSDLIDECIKMNRDPQKHCLFYCKECPLERSKNMEIVEPCKGHSVRSFIKECWLKCGCNKRCGNRVVQRGIQRKLQVFMTPGGKGWGLRTLEDLPKGAFVCEYVGEVLTNAELYERVSKSSNKDEHAYPVLLDADWAAESELKDEEALCLDATYYGNVARFINHRCFDSTLVEIPVEVENPDHHYYHLAFFTTRKVKALEELTWDYGIDFDDEEHPVKAFRCRCGSRFCRNTKRPYRSRKRRYT